MYEMGGVCVVWGMYQLLKWGVCVVEMWGMYQLQKWCRNVSVVDAEMGGVCVEEMWGMYQLLKWGYVL